MISVITPSYGQLDWLRLCVASVADQGGSGGGIEHIVQDAGTEGIAESSLAAPRCADDYQLLLYVEKDAGMYDAINRGLKRAHGEICAYLNCDEQYLPGTLAKVAAFFDAHPTIDVLFGDVILVDQDGHPLSYRRTVLPSLIHVRLSHLNTASCATFFRRRLLERGFYFDPQWKAIGDTAWVYELLNATVEMRTLAEPLAVFAFTGKNLGATAVSTEESERLRNGVSLNSARGIAAVVSHRIRKLLAGAYRRRRTEIEIYTRDSPRARQRRIAENVGFRWPAS